MCDLFSDAGDNSTDEAGATFDVPPNSLPSTHFIAPFL